MATVTAILGLVKPNDGEYAWGVRINQNMDKIDQIITAQHKADGTHQAVTADTLAVSGNTSLQQVSASTLVVSGDVMMGGVSIIAALAEAATAKNERILAQQAASQSAADKLAVDAAWAAALAANPSLNAQVKMNPAQVSADISIPSNYNASAVGPLEVASNINITVGINANLNIV